MGIEPETPTSKLGKDPISRSRDTYLLYLPPSFPILHLVLNKTAPNGLFLTMEAYGKGDVFHYGQNAMDKFPMEKEG
jgi:hypothetical protein